MNWYFYRIFLPLTVLTAILTVSTFQGEIQFHWGVALFTWFLIGPLGIGVGYHRLFSHRQFETFRFVELTLATLGTLAAYAPLLFWVTNHQHHHIKSDQVDDPSSPGRHGFWESFLLYRMRERNLGKVDITGYCSKRAITDRSLRLLSKHFTTIVWITILGFALIGLDWLYSAYLIPVFVEHCRVNVVSSLSHTRVPFSYRNFSTDDDSQNNLIIGILGMGFGWHNNHHHDERGVNNQVRWWELDVEGLCAQALSRQNGSQGGSSK